MPIELTIYERHQPGIFTAWFKEFMRKKSLLELEEIKLPYSEVRYTITLYGTTIVQIKTRPVNAENVIKVQLAQLVEPGQKVKDEAETATVPEFAGSFCQALEKESQNGAFGTKGPEKQTLVVSEKPPTDEDFSNYAEFLVQTGHRDPPYPPIPKQLKTDFKHWRLLGFDDFRWAILWEGKGRGYEEGKGYQEIREQLVTAIWPVEDNISTQKISEAKPSQQGQQSADSKSISTNQKNARKAIGGRKMRQPGQPGKNTEKIQKALEWQKENGGTMKEALALQGLEPHHLKHEREIQKRTQMGDFSSE